MYFRILHTLYTIPYYILKYTVVYTIVPVCTLFHTTVYFSIYAVVCCILYYTTVLIYTIPQYILLPARRYASAGYRDRNVSVRPSVCPSVRPSRAGIVSKRRKLAA